MSNIGERLHFLPVQFIQVEGGIVLRRGICRVQINGDGVADAVLRLISTTTQGATIEEILEAFEPGQRSDVEQLVGELRARRLLATVEDSSALPLLGQEDRLDIFYWNVGAVRTEVERELAERSVALVGLNAVALAAADSLQELGFGRVEVVDYPLLRNIDYVDDKGAPNQKWTGPKPLPFDAWDTGETPDCIIVTSDFGGLSLMSDWNAYCVASGVPFLPIVLHDFTGYIGPLVVPGETACFKCFLLRQDSNLEQPQTVRAAEGAAFHGQIIDGMVPTMAALLGRIGAFELFKFFSKRVPSWRPDHVTELDLLESTMKRRKFLRVPRCPVCSQRGHQGAVSIETETDMPGHMPAFPV